MLDLQQADIGIAMSHFELTARESGMQGSWIVSDPGIIFAPVQARYIVTWKPR